ncbi:hypothetical protein [Xanthomonas arboricola]|uniref:hypothetical protein n=1 Tax=Xanthomonas arboricola TaxID=56448 RepID=UPI00160B2C61|nr:hypothetical protein [Xanthomonas arboricola]MBB5860206.1 hypothetical protein [Xanthomonas arboricola]
MLKKTELVAHVKSPWFLAPVCLAIGAAVPLMILGVPKLWTAEAAGWASAVATTLAATIALTVGLLPELNRRREGWVRALAKLHLAEMSLEVQLVHVGRAIELSRSEHLASTRLAAIHREMQSINSAPLHSLLLDGAHFNKAGFAATCRCVVDVERVKALTDHFDQAPPQHYIEGSWFRDLAVDLYLTIDETRKTYAFALEREPSDVPNVPTEVEVRQRKTPIAEN